MDTFYEINKRIRVRFAPSPTGPLHIGGLRTALYNYLFAKKMGGDFLLRIEDTDQNRFVPGAEQYIIDSLNWCGIEISEGVSKGGPYAPYKQSERKGIYKQYADSLIETGNAYYAFDSPGELEKMREKLSLAGMASPQYNYVTRESMRNSLTLPTDHVQELLNKGEAYVIRIKIPRKEEVKVKDLIRGNVTVHSSQMDDKVLFKSDGMPTYHLANVVDDYLMKITHVIRGEEWLPSAPLHVLLYRFLGWEKDMPEFAHLPLLLKPDGNGKLSKRDGDRLGFPVFPLDWIDPVTGEQSSGYRERGYYPEAVVNFLALLGWNPGTNQELFTMEELIQSFSIERISKSGAKFDINKAKWFNQQYLRLQPIQDLSKNFEEILREKNIDFSSNKINKIIDLVKEKAHFEEDFWSLSSFFFEDPLSYDAQSIAKKWNLESFQFLEKLMDNLLMLIPYQSSTIEKYFGELAAQMHIKPGSMMQITRVSLTGVNIGPALFEMMEVMGLPLCVSRIKLAIQYFPDL